MPLNGDPDVSSPFFRAQPTYSYQLPPALTPPGVGLQLPWMADCAENPRVPGQLSVL